MTPDGALAVKLRESMRRREAGDLGGAESLCREVMAGAQDQTLLDTASEILGLLLWEQGQDDAAVDVWLRIVRTRVPPPVELAAEVAATMLHEGRADDSLRLLREALRRAPAHAETHVQLAETLARLGALDEACEHYEQALQVAPDLAGARERRDQLRQAIARNAGFRRRLEEIGKQIVARHGDAVLGGPFAGTRLLGGRDFAWVAELIGCYEEELHQPIEALLEACFDRVINIGCAGGYYAVGLARRLPAARVFAFDIDPARQEDCRQLAAHNGVADRVTVLGKCTSAALSEVLDGRCLVFCDCEGAELSVLQPEKVVGLRQAHLLVELHDFIVPDLTQRLLPRFEPTHHLQIVSARDRDPTAYAALAGLAADDQALAVSDFRPPQMTWAVLRPRE